MTLALAREARHANDTRRVALAMEDRDRTPERLSLERLSPALGAEVTGLDAARLRSPALGTLLHQALLANQLLLLRGLDLDPASFRRLGLGLGSLRRVPYGMQIEPGMPDVQRLSNGLDPYTLNWHADGSAARIPPRYTLFYAVRVPRHGGETHFADMYAACAALSTARRRALVGRVAIHDPELARRFRYGHPLVPVGTGIAQSLRARIRLLRRALRSDLSRHPVIRVHEETGRESLFLGDHAWRVTRCRWSSGRRLVNELNAFATSRSEWTYAHSWRAGDLVIWDNRCLLHRASEYDAAHEERIMLRAVVDGPIAPVE